MEFIADFHIHSKYSRATSRDMDVVHIAEWAKLKGVTLMGTGDFTHHLWLEELKYNLEDLGNGLYKHPATNRGGSATNSGGKDIYFILTSEISSIYSKKGKTYRIHNMVFSPSFKTTDKINETLARYGNLASDGRPILGMDAAELARIIFDIDENCMVVPAHCLVPGTLVHTQNGFKSIEDITKKDSIYTHKMRIRKVTDLFKREYQGNVLQIKPYYFREGIKVTPEHPFYIIKTSKNCLSRGSFCAPNCAHLRSKGCRRKYFEQYSPQWAQAKDIEINDIMVFPRFNNRTLDVDKIEVKKIIGRENFVIKKNKIAFRGNKTHFVNNLIKVDKDFCRLAGYFVSEGYTNSRDCVSFCFLEEEKEYINDVAALMKRIFGIKLSKTQTKQDVKAIELIFYSKVLYELFSKLFYTNIKIKRAHSKSLPEWMLDLPLEKQVEIIKGWWRGDKGYTASRILMNQMKVLFLRLGIIPSIGIDSIEKHKNRGRHFTENREILAQHDTFHFSNLSFFENRFTLLNDSEFKKFKTKLSRRHGWIDNNYVYLPVRSIGEERYKGTVYNLEVKDDNSYICEFATVHNCWTPWFSLFGSMSGFDRIEDCFEDQTPKIFALETGLSCYDEKTEVLTENGWKKFTDVSYSDKVCTLNSKTDHIEFQPPQRIFSYIYKGKMYKLKTSRVNLLVTPNHKLLYSPCDFRNRKPFMLKEAERLFKKSKILKKDGVWVGKDEDFFTLPEVRIRHGSRYYSGFRNKKQMRLPINPWLKFFGFWIAEGWTTGGKDGDYNVCVCNNNMELLNEMKQILESFGYRVFQRKNVIRVRDFQLFHYLKQFGKCYDKFIPIDIKSLSKELLEILLEYYIKGDGHIYGRTRKGLSATTTSVRLRDDLQEIALKIGISAYYKRGQKKGTPFHSACSKKIYKQRNHAWIVYFIRRNRPVILPSTIKKHHYIESWVDYSGFVYCLMVPNHVVYIRREGIPLWCGNSDPAMNWRLSVLDKFTLISNSDSHSPAKIGREANVFNCALDYNTIRNVLKNKDREKFLYTIEFFPEEGKYHFDGHRLCAVRLSPKETKQNNGRCPKCGKPVTVGVMNRVEQLADRPEGFVPPNKIPYKNLIPLEEIIAEARGVGKSSVAVERDYRGAVAKFGTEFEILLRASREDLLKGLSGRIAEGVLRVRQGKVKIKAGFDGEYGIISIFGDEEKSAEGEKQLSLF